MVYIAFSNRSHKILAKIMCRNFRHCAPVVIRKNKIILYQFIKPKHIVPIGLHEKDLKILQQFGWVFIKYSCSNIQKHSLYNKSLTCVQFTKHVCNIKNLKIQTPDSLFKYLQNK